MPRGIYERTQFHNQRLSEGQKEAYRTGRRISWNKGKHHTKEHIEKMRNSLKGHKVSEETKRKIGDAQRGEKGSNYRGGQMIKDGYIHILMPKHPFASKRDGYVKRANLVMEKILGRYLIFPEFTHHKGIKYPIGSIENKQDDRIENLQLFANQKEHTKFHWKECGKKHRN